MSFVFIHARTNPLKTGHLNLTELCISLRKNFDSEIRQQPFKFPPDLESSK